MLKPIKQVIKYCMETLKYAFLLGIFQNITKLSMAKQNLFIVVSEFAIFYMQFGFWNFQKDSCMY